MIARSAVLTYCRETEKEEQLIDHQEARHRERAIEDQNHELKNQNQGRARVKKGEGIMEHPSAVVLGSVGAA